MDRLCGEISIQSSGVMHASAPEQPRLNGDPGTWNLAITPHRRIPKRSGSLPWADLAAVPSPDGVARRASYHTAATASTQAGAASFPAGHGVSANQTISSMHAQGGNPNPPQAPVSPPQCAQATAQENARAAAEAAAALPVVGLHLDEAATGLNGLEPAGTSATRAPVPTMVCGQQDALPPASTHATTAAAAANGIWYGIYPRPSPTTCPPGPEVRLDQHEAVCTGASTHTMATAAPDDEAQRSATCTPGPDPGMQIHQLDKEPIDARTHTTAAAASNDAEPSPVTCTPTPGHVLQIDQQQTVLSDAPTHPTTSAVANASGPSPATCSPGTEVLPFHTIPYHTMLIDQREAEPIKASTHSKAGAAASELALSPAVCTPTEPTEPTEPIKASTHTTIVVASHNPATRKSEEFALINQRIALPPASTHTTVPACIRPELVTAAFQLGSTVMVVAASTKELEPFVGKLGSVSSYEPFAGTRDTVPGGTAAAIVGRGMYVVALPTETATGSTNQICRECELVEVDKPIQKNSPCTTQMASRVQSKTAHEKNRRPAGLQHVLANTATTDIATDIANVTPTITTTATATTTATDTADIIHTHTDGVGLPEAAEKKSVATSESSTVPEPSKDAYKKCVCETQNWKAVLLCDGCDAEFCLCCVGLNKIPEEDRWFCPVCCLDGVPLLCASSTTKALPSTDPRDVGYGAFVSHLELSRAPYALYGVKYIDLVSLGAFVPATSSPRSALHGTFVPQYLQFLPHFVYMR